MLFQRDGGEKRGQTYQEEYASYRPGAQAGFAGGLSTHASFLRPTAVLFDGGTFKGRPLLDQILEVLNGWLDAEGTPPVRLLEGADLDLACASRRSA